MRKSRYVPLSGKNTRLARNSEIGGPVSPAKLTSGCNWIFVLKLVPCMSRSKLINSSIFSFNSKRKT